MTLPHFQALLHPLKQRDTCCSCHPALQGSQPKEGPFRGGQGRRPPQSAAPEGATPGMGGRRGGRPAVASPPPLKEGAEAEGKRRRAADNRPGGAPGGAEASRLQRPPPPHTRREKVGVKRVGEGYDGGCGAPGLPTPRPSRASPASSTRALLPTVPARALFCGAASLPLCV